jgi:hypothetical protein
MAKQNFSTGQVLTANQMLSLQQTAMGGGSPSQKTASYVLVAADAGTVIQMNSASATTITVNTSLFSAGDSVQIQNIGSGTTTITAGTATVNSAGSLAVTQYDGGFLYFTTTSAALWFDYTQAGTTSPLTTKGDLYTRTSSADSRLAVGANGTTLVADSAETTGLKWATPSSTPTFIGAVVGFSADKTIASVTTTVLTMDTELFDSNGFHSTSSDTSRLTIPAGYAGKYFISSQLFPIENSSGRREIRFRKNGTEISGWNMNQYGTMEMIQHYAYVDASVNDYFEVTFRQNTGGNLTLYGSTNVAGSAWCFNIQYLGA